MLGIADFVRSPGFAAARAARGTSLWPVPELAQVTVPCPGQDQSRPVRRSAPRPTFPPARTVYQARLATTDVNATVRDDNEGHGEVLGDFAAGVPTDGRTWRPGARCCRSDSTSKRRGPDRSAIQIPVCGGVAGGSPTPAATLWRATALGLQAAVAGRLERVGPTWDKRRTVPAGRAPPHWAGLATGNRMIRAAPSTGLRIAEAGLSTAAVYRNCDVSDRCCGWKRRGWPEPAVRALSGRPARYWLP